MGIKKYIYIHVIVIQCGSVYGVYSILDIEK